MDTSSPLSPDVWERTPAEAQASIRALAARGAALEAPVQRRLERLRMDAQHSSPPPSRDPPAMRTPRRRRTPSGRKPGGPPGHQGQPRAFGPLEAVEAVLPVTPPHCARCPHPWPGEDGQPQRPQVTDLPPRQPVGTAYPWHSRLGPVWGATTRAALPRGGPAGDCGPRVQASVALCTGAYHLAKRTTQDVRGALCGLPLRLGTLANLEHATGQALAAPGAAAQTHVRAQSIAHLDETGWRAGQARAWRWVAGTAWGTVCVVRLSRGAKVAQERLGERCCGTLVTERWRADTWSPTRWRQGGWAHRLRAFDAMIERGGRAQAMGTALRDQARQMLHAWHRVGDGTLPHAEFRVLMRPMRCHVARLLKAGQTCGVAKTEGGGREGRKVSEALGTFVRVEGVEPTTNAAERAIRPGVLWRKGRFGTQSAHGARFVEAMMTVVATLTQQHRHVLAYMTEVCQAADLGAPAPSLLPCDPQTHAELPAGA